MDKLTLTGGNALRGEVTVSGAKNAALPILCAGLLTADTVTLTNVPELRDIGTTLKLLTRMGARAERAACGTIEISAPSIDNLEAPYDLV